MRLQRASYLSREWQKPSQSTTILTFCPDSKGFAMERPLRPSFGNSSPHGSIYKLKSPDSLLAKSGKLFVAALAQVQVAISLTSSAVCILKRHICTILSDKTGLFSVVYKHC